MEVALKEARVWLPPIVVSEILSAKLSPADRKSLNEMLAELPLCSCTFDHWVRVGELRAACAAKGIKISTPDAHVAQCALDLGGYLASEDGVFEKISKATALRLAK